MSDLLDEYRAARDKIDAAAGAVFERRAEDLACRRGCARCCASGLSVLSVEVAAIERFLDENDPPAVAPPPEGCAFLDDEGACTIYDARPVVCRTHGLPLRMPGSDGAQRERRALRVLGDVEVCALNFSARPFEAADVLDGERIAALLLVVEQRYRARAGKHGALERVPLASLLTATGR